MWGYSINPQEKKNMKIYLDCYPCFLEQALKTLRFIQISEEKQKEIIREVAGILAKLNPGENPAEIGGKVYSLIQKKTGVHDPFKEIKRECNEILLRFYPEIKKKVEENKNPLLYALKMAACGNIIDYGIGGRNVDIKKVISSAAEEKFGICEYENFRKDLNKAKLILFLGDNAGEIVFDRILIEELKKNWNGGKIVYAVRESPIINDALMEDAEMVGLTEICTVISSGCSTPGTIIKLCSQKFLEIYEGSDLIISKGQGNYESMEGEKGKNIYFILKAKCEVVAKHLQCNTGDLVCKRIDN